MASAQSIVGYVPDAVAKELHAGKGLRDQTLELPLDPGKGAAKLRVKLNDIEEVRVGPSAGGHTGLQVVLRPEAKYEVVATAIGKDFQAIRDPVFWYGLGRPGWVAIFVGPIYRPIDNVLRLVELKAV